MLAILEAGERRAPGVLRRAMGEFGVGPDGEMDIQLFTAWAVHHHRAGGRTLAEHFLYEKKAPDKVPDEERAWLVSQSRSWVSPWEVVSLKRGESLGVIDRLTGAERQVNEAGGSQLVDIGQLILGRVVDHLGVSRLCGTSKWLLSGEPALRALGRMREELRLSPEGNENISPDELREEGLALLLLDAWYGAVTPSPLAVSESSTEPTADSSAGSIAGPSAESGTD